jgi:hypothetical protein
MSENVKLITDSLIPRLKYKTTVIYYFPSTIIMQNYVIKNLKTSLINLWQQKSAHSQFE